MHKNGFIATSVLYSFFLVFVTLFLGLIMNYINNRMLVAKINEEAQEKVAEMTEKKLTDLNVGDYILLNIKDTTEYTAVNVDSKWVVAYKNCSGEFCSIWLLSDLNAENLTVKLKSSSDSFAKYHINSISIYEEMVSSNSEQYGTTSSPLIETTESANQVPFYVRTIKASEFETIISFLNGQSDYVKDNVLKTNGDYAINVDTDSYAYKSGEYAAGYYYMRSYQFDYNDSADVESLCGTTRANYQSSPASYPLTYISEDKDSQHNVTFTEYCSRINPTTDNYTSSLLSKHSILSTVGEESRTDYINNYKHVSSYIMRFIGKIDNLSVNSAYSYIASGEGTYQDPYVFKGGAKK